MALTEHRQNVTLEYSLKDCIDALNEALDWKLSNDGVKLDRFDEKLNTFFLKAGVSAFSWGENLTVTMKANQNGTTEITIVSAPKTGTMFGGLTDMGKNRKNIDLVLKHLSFCLESKERIVPTNINHSTSSNSSALDEIKKLKELLDMGAITQEEFDIKKKEILGF